MLKVETKSVITLKGGGTGNLATAGPCPTCNLALPPLSDIAPQYFRENAVQCSECKAAFDLWPVTLGYGMALPASAWGLASLGASSLHLLTPLQTGCYQRIDIREHGAPEGSRILWTAYTSQGGSEGAVMALEAHGNSPHRRIMGTEIQLYGIPLGEGTVPRTGNVAISIVWVRAEDSESWPYLVSAFESIALRDYAPAMVFAQSAVEIAMMPMISRRLRVRAGAERVTAFMRDALTYGHALNVILPYLCGEIGVSPMPDSVRGSLNKLRGIRNRIIHEGVKSSEISAEDVTEGITAAAFGFEFTRYLHPLL